MFFKRLILTVLAVAGLILPVTARAAEAVSSCTIENVSQNNNRPQWSDLGMEHILAVCGQSNITPPSPVRLASQGRRLSGGNSNSSNSPEMASPPVDNHRTVLQVAHLHVSYTRGFLYIIRCLRL